MQRAEACAVRRGVCKWGITFVGATCWSPADAASPRRMWYCANPTPVPCYGPGRAITDRPYRGDGPSTRLRRTHPGCMHLRPGGGGKISHGDNATHWHIIHPGGGTVNPKPGRNAEDFPSFRPRREHTDLCKKYSIYFPVCPLDFSNPK